jgi:hypothetical protein
MTRLIPFAAVLLMCISFALTSATGQSSAVTISGTVSDSANQELPGVTITLRNADANSDWKTLTDEKGTYVCSNLLPGTYDLEASLAGFQTATISNLKTDAGQIFKMNFTIHVGGPSRGPLQRGQGRDLPKVGKCA